MKILEEFVLREVAGNYIVVPFGENAVSFKAMITLNETGAFLWMQLEEEKTQEELLEAFLQEYEIDRQTAEADISKFIEKVESAGILEQ